LKAVVSARRMFAFLYSFFSPLNNFLFCIGDGVIIDAFPGVLFRNRFFTSAVFADARLT